MDMDFKSPTFNESYMGEILAWMSLLDIYTD